MSKLPELLYCVTVEDLSFDGALGAEMLSALELDFSTWVDRENRRVIHTVYSQSKEEADQAELRVREACKVWADFGFKYAEIGRSELEKEDWSEAWKKFFKPIDISPRLTVCPSWIRLPEVPGRKILTIDPGMSFGSGGHATTLFCLKMIDRLGAEKPGMSLLDAGCGSGILAIAGALSNFKVIDAFDFDPDAVEIAKENFALNRVTTVTPEVGDASDYKGRPEKYDLVCANILAHLLKSFRVNIASWVKQEGYLSLAGILETEFQSVVDVYGELGFQLVEAETLREWRSGLFVRK